jgi:hypothetical protein
MGLFSVGPTRLARAGPAQDHFFREFDMSVGGVNYVIPPELQGGNIPDVTYRGDTRPPEVIFDQGFQPRQNGTEAVSREGLLDYAENNTPGPWVSTSRDPEVAADFVGDQDGWVYDVEVPRDRAVDVNHALGTDSPYPQEDEIAVAGGIIGEDVISATNTRTGEKIFNEEYEAESPPPPPPAPPPPAPAPPTETPNPEL